MKYLPVRRSSAGSSHPLGIIQGSLRQNFRGNSADMVNLPATGKLCDYRLPPKSFPAEKQLPFTVWKNYRIDGAFTAEKARYR